MLPAGIHNELGPTYPRDDFPQFTKLNSKYPLPLFILGVFYELILHMRLSDS
jgi:hypothetical protein